MIRGIRCFCSSVRLPSSRGPRFIKTITEAGKPALTKPQIISRPFGFDEPVEIGKRLHSGFSIWNLNRELFGEEAKERRQQKLDYELTHSPFYESKSFTNTNGRIFNSPVSYFKATKAKYFPNFSDLTLEKKHQSLYDLLQGQVGIVRLYSTVSGEKCTNTYFQVEGQDYLTSDYQQFKQRFPNTKIIDINIPENSMKTFIVKLSLGSIRKLIPQDRHQGYFVSSQSTFPYNVRQTLMCDNLCSGYIYLVDNHGRLRWATSGYANESDLKLMWKAVAGLEKELTAPQLE